MPSRAGDVAIALEGITKRFGDVEAVRDVSFEVRDGEFFSLLGSSGCGKTTTLRMIAGFQEPDRGRILLDDTDVTRVPPNRRAVNMVFQNYALFPHMTVFENVAFGLKLKKVPRDEQRTRVQDMLRIVRLQDMGHRRPSQLSGGQQQRVALARALVNRPTALLLDEPLGALDVKLRRQMGLELKRIQAELGTTFVYVTHDQEEALSMSDRIAIMNHGVVEQIGIPREVYERPASAFVADFVGVLNAVDVRIDEVVDGAAIMRVGADERVVVAGHFPVGGRCTLAIRPEHLRLHRAPESPNADGSRLVGRVTQVIYLGTVTQLHVETNIGVRFVSVRLNHERSQEIVEGSAVTLTWDTEDAFVLRDPSVPVEGLHEPAVDG